MLAIQYSGIYELQRPGEGDRDEARRAPVRRVRRLLLAAASASSAGVSPASSGPSRIAASTRTWHGSSMNRDERRSARAGAATPRVIRIAVASPWPSCRASTFLAWICPSSTRRSRRRCSTRARPPATPPQECPRATSETGNADWIARPSDALAAGVTMIRSYFAAITLLALTASNVDAVERQSGDRRQAAPGGRDRPRRGAWRVGRSRRRNTSRRRSRARRRSRST